MKRLLVLLLVGFLGYIAYPSIPPNFFGLAEKEEETSPEPVNSSQIKPEEVVVLPDQTVNEKGAETKRPISHKMVEKDVLPEVVIEPDREEEPEEEPVVKVPELDETDMKIIITKAVEAGGRIDFRRENIISWKLKDLAISRQGSQYVGEIGVELGTLFGPELRRAKVVIKDKAIESWEWLEAD